MNNELMIDIETLGTDYGCIILSVACVSFNPVTGENLGEYYNAINVDDSKKLGFTTDVDTLHWWMKQSKEAYNDATSGKMHPYEVVKELNDFIASNSSKKTKVWANPTQFDLTILSAYYDRLDIKKAWAHWNERCLRTTVDILHGKEIKDFVLKNANKTTRHNALYDCYLQIQYLTEIRKNKNI